MIQGAGRRKKEKDFVVGFDLNTVLGPSELRSPFLERIDNGCKFLVIDRVVYLKSCEFTRLVTYWMVYPNIVGL